MVVGALSLVGSGLVGSGSGLVVSVLSVAVDELLADLLGQGELHLLALGLSEGDDALLHRLCGILHLGLGDTLLLGEDLTADAGEGDGLVDTGLDGLGVADANLNITGSDNGHIVGGLLLNLLAVLVAVLLVTMTVAGLADGDHLGIALLLEADLHGLGCGVLVLLVIAVAADLIINHLSALRADSAGDIVAVLSIDNALDGQLNIGALGLKSGRADLSDLNNILNAAVVLGLLVTAIGRLGVVRSWLGVVGSWGGVVGGWCMVVGRLGAVGGRLGMIGGRLMMVRSRCGVVGCGLRVVGSGLGVVGSRGTSVVEGFGVAMGGRHMGNCSLAVLMRLAMRVGLAAKGDAGEGASVWGRGRQ